MQKILNVNVEVFIGAFDAEGLNLVSGSTESDTVLPTPSAVDSESSNVTQAAVQPRRIIARKHHEFDIRYDAFMNIKRTKFGLV